MRVILINGTNCSSSADRNKGCNLPKVDIYIDKSVKKWEVNQTTMFFYYVNKFKSFSNCRFYLFGASLNPIRNAITKKRVYKLIKENPFDTLIVAKSLGCYIAFRALKKLKYKQLIYLNTIDAERLGKNYQPDINVTRWNNYYQTNSKLGGTIFEKADDNYKVVGATHKTIEECLYG